MSSRSDRLTERLKKSHMQATEVQRHKNAQWKKKRQEACKKREVIKLRKRDAARARRLAIKSNAEEYELQKQKERERWKTRVNEGRVLTRDKMSNRDRRLARKRVRESLRKHRETKKNKCIESEKIKAFPQTSSANVKEELLSMPSLSSEEVALSVLRPRKLRGSKVCGSPGSGNKQVEIPGAKSCKDDLEIESRPSSSLSDCRSSKAVAEMKIKGRKKKSAMRTAAHKKLAQQTKKNITLQRALWRCRRQLTLTRKKLPSSPRSEIRRQLRGKKVSPEVNNKLVFGEVLKREVKQSLNNNSIKVKKAGYQILRGSILKKYRLQFSSELSGRMLRQARKKESHPFQQKKAVGKKKLGHIQEVHNFFLSDENSIECADKNAVKILFGKNKIQKRKRYLRGTLKDLYVSYQQKVEKPLSYSRFCAFKPFHVVRRDLKERDTCLCTQCENMELLISALHQAKVLEPNSNLSFLRSICCAPRKESCYRRTCDDCKEKKIVFMVCDDENLQVKYSKWASIQETKTDSKTGKDKLVKRTIKKQDTATIKSLKEAFLEGQEKFLDHTFRDKHQLLTLKSRRENLTSGDIYLWIDFSENYSCKYSREVQRHYYGASRENVVLHSGRVYLEGESHSFCTASECMRKDPSAIIAHILPILRKFMKPGIATLHMQSDSPSTQYRNKDMFYLVVKYLTKLFPQITNIYWNYTEAGHGKGAPDGVASKAKNTADLAIQNGQDVATFKDLVAVLKDKTQNLIIDTVDSSEIQAVQEVLPKLQAFNGTFQVHQFTWTKEHSGAVQMNSVSCYDCPAGTECTHFKLENSPWILPQEVTPNAAVQVNPPPPIRDTGRKRKAKQAVETESDLDDPQPLQNTRKKRHVNQPDLKNIAYAVGDWVVVQYGRHWYPGLVEKVSSLKTTVNFLVKHEKEDFLFLWPPKEDIQSVFKKDILYKLIQQPRAVDRRHFQIHESDLTAINAIST